MVLIRPIILTQSKDRTNKKAMFYRTSSKCWPKVVQITLGSNYAKHYLGVGHVQPHAYHQIPTNVSIK